MDYNIREAYRQYNKDYRGTDWHVDTKTFLHIISDFMKYMFQRILEGHDVSVPNHLGVLSIRGRKMNPQPVKNQNYLRGIPPDWSKIKKLKEQGIERPQAYHHNYHTDGIVYRLFWFKQNHIFKNARVYSFKLCRANKRLIAHKIKSELKEYQLLNTSKK